MKEFSMFYKIRNILLIMLSFVLTSVEAKAQGVISLSEEAMFEDELDTEIVQPKADKKEAPAVVPVEITDELGVRAPVKAPVSEELPQLDIPAQTKPLPVVEDVELSSDVDEDLPVADFRENSNSDLYNSLDGKTNLKGADVFEHMSDIEKRTAILNLELRREKLQDDIEAIKYKRREALAQEKQKEEAQRLKNLEAEKEIERKIIEEQAKLRELDIQFEKIRQEKVLGAYKNKMLEETQKWIEHDGIFYKQINELRDAKLKMAEGIKEKMTNIKNNTVRIREDFVRKVADYEKRLEDKDSQIDILRNRIANLEREREEYKRNPFAGFDKAQLAAAAGIDISVLEAVTQAQALSGDSLMAEGSEPVETDLTKMYGVTEIRGKGDELVARLVNQSGTAFYVKKGTKLQSGHVVDKITTTYVMADKNGDRQYLYFSAGGILPTEVTGLDVTKLGESEETE